MKKIISLILIAILCLGVLTSCDQLGGVVDSIKDKLGMGEQPVEGPSLDDAAAYLHKIYKDKKEKTDKDFDVVAVIVIDGVKFPVTWTSDNANVVVRESTKTGYYTIDLPDLNTEEFSYTLTATISDGNGNSTQKAYSFKVPVIDNSGITSTPVEGVAYKLFLKQANLGKRYYALNTTQDNANKFINTTEDPKAGAEFFVEKVDGGYKVYTLVDGVKNYIEIHKNDQGKVRIWMTTEATQYYVLDTEANTWVINFEGTNYYLGTYNAFTTIGCSSTYYITGDKAANVGVSQYVVEWVEYTA